MTERPEVGTPAAAAAAVLDMWRHAFTGLQDTDEWDMPVEVLLVTVEPIGPPDPDHPRMLPVMTSMKVMGNAEGLLNTPALGTARALTLAAELVRSAPHETALEFAGLATGHHVVALALVVEVWGIDGADITDDELIHLRLTEGKELSEHPAARESRMLVGIDYLGHLYRIAQRRGDARRRYDDYVDLPGLAGPGTPEDMANVDTLVDRDTFVAMGGLLSALGRLSDAPTYGEGLS